MEKLSCKRLIENLAVDSQYTKDFISLKEALARKLIKKIDKNHVVELAEGSLVKLADPKNIGARYKHAGSMFEKKTCQELIAKLNFDDSWEEDEISVMEAIDNKLLGKMDKNHVIDLGDEGFVQVADPENVDIRYKRFSNFIEKMTCRELINELDHSQFLERDSLSLHDAVELKIFGPLDKNNIIDWLEVGKIEITDPKAVRTQYPLWQV